MMSSAALYGERAARRAAVIAAIHRESVRAQRKRLERLAFRRVA
jgi:hypothetical protein